MQTELSQFLRGILDHTRELLSAEGASIFLLDGEFLRLAAASGVEVEGEDTPHIAYHIGEGITGAVARTRKHLVLNDYREFATWQPNWDYIEGSEIRNMLASPIVSGDKFIGVVRCANKRWSPTTQDGFNQRDVETLEIFARAVAVAIETRRELANAINAPYVFVLMPFHADFRDTYELGIKSVSRALGIRCERVDEIEFNDVILDQIYKGIQRADMVIADMSGRNPNVFYEVGYAHALRKDVVLLTREAADIPFDLRSHNHIVYDGRIIKLQELLRKRLIAWLERHAAGEAVEAANEREITAARQPRQ